MGECRFCGKPAGVLRRKHKECETKHSHALDEIVSASRTAAVGELALDRLAARVETAGQWFVTPQEVRACYVQAWEAAADHFLEDRVLDHAEEGHLATFQKELKLDQDELDRNGAFSRVARSAVLRDVLEGKVPTRFTVEGTLPFNFQENEKLVWVFSRVDYLEDKTRREYVGRSAGVSVRIMRGVYYRVGAFRGHPIERTERVLVDNGAVAVTTKHVYFAGSVKSFRVRHDKIVSLLPFSDGVGFFRDAATAKLQVLVTADGWFTYNLLANVNQLADA